jgi:HEPN domain-containing protein
MNRDDFRKLAETRLEDARALLNAGRFGAAYYMAGYAVECALKACICKNMREFDFPPRDASQYYQHDLMRLSAIAQIESAFEQERKQDPLLAAYWNVVKDWREDSRYQDTGPEAERAAKGLIEAISESQHGVLQWLSKYW